MPMPVIAVVVIVVVDVVAFVVDVEARTDVSVRVSLTAGLIFVHPLILPTDLHRGSFHYLQVAVVVVVVAPVAVVVHHHYSNDYGLLSSALVLI